MTTQLSLLDRDWVNIYAPVVLASMKGREFSTDDLHQILPEPEQRNWYGALMARLRNLGLVEKVGYRPSQRQEANGRVVAVWRIKSPSHQIDESTPECADCALAQKIVDSR